MRGSSPLMDTMLSIRGEDPLILLPRDLLETQRWTGISQRT